MFMYTRRIHLKDTDMTGVIFFSHLFTIAGEAFESFLFEKEVFIEKKQFFLPVVHAEADYEAPIKMGDLLSIELNLEKMGTSSFTLESKILNQRKEKVAMTKIVHVVIERASWTSMPIPKDLSLLLSALES